MGEGVGGAGDCGECEFGVDVDSVGVVCEGVEEEMGWEGVVAATGWSKFQARGAVCWSLISRKRMLGEASIDVAGCVKQLTAALLRRRASQWWLSTSVSMHEAFIPSSQTHT